MLEHVLIVDSQEIANPEWLAIERAVRSIGPKAEQNTVRLTAPKDELPWLTVGGQLNGRYSLTLEPCSGEAWVLLDPSEPDEDVQVHFPFGEFDIVSKRELTALSVVLQASSYYFKMLKPDPRLTWRRFSGGETSVVGPQL